MLLARGQSVERTSDLLPCNPQGVFNQHSFYHQRQHRAAGERRRAAISQKPRGFDSPIAQTQ